jgi:hypothetical protein
MLSNRPLSCGVLEFLMAASLPADPAGKEVVMKQAEAAEDGRPAAVVLKDVPWVGFYQGPKKGNPEDHPLPSVMRSLMEYLDDDLGLPGFADQRGKWRWEACALFHGVTGSGFGFCWEQPYGEGHLGRKLFHTYETAFAAAGYACRPLLRKGFAATQDYSGAVSDDEAEYRRLIVESIRDRQLPVIAIGVIGPDEPCLITGFEDGGAVITGWNFFLDEGRKDPRVSYDQDGRFVMREWFGTTRGIVLPGPKLAHTQDPSTLCIDTLCRDLAILCDIGSDERPRGIAAYQGWITYLLSPIAEPVASDPRQLSPLHTKHNDPIGELAERRAYAATFLGQMAEALPELGDDLREAQHCNQAMHDLLWRVWQTLGVWHRTDDDKLRRFAKPEYRQELASLVRRLQAWDLESATHIRTALLRLGMPEADLPAIPTLPPAKGLRDLGIDEPLPGQLGRLWETPTPAIPGMPAPEGAGVAAAMRAATTPTPWPIANIPAPDADLRAWAAQAGWEVRIVEMLPGESILEPSKRVNDVILSCLYGLPVATTYKGRPAVIVGYDHLAGEKLRVRLPDQRADDPPAAIRLDDEGWGPTWIFLVGRR